MMSEQRFTFKCNDDKCSIFENGVWLKIEEVVYCLNEQQSTIEHLKETIKSVEKQLEDNYHLEIEDGYVVPSMKDIAKDYFDLLLEDAKREFGDLKYVQDGKVIDE